MARVTFRPLATDLQSATSKYSQNLKNQEEQKVHMHQCHKHSTPQLLVTAVKGPVGQQQGCTLTVQTVAIKPPVSDCVQYQSCSLEADINTRARALCSCIAGQTLQKGHIVLQHCRSYGQIPALCLRRSKDHPASDRHLWPTGLPPSNTTHLLQLGDMPTQFNAVDLLYLISSIFVSTATHQFANNVRARYVPFIFMSQSSGVGSVLCALGEHS